MSDVSQAPAIAVVVPAAMAVKMTYIYKSVIKRKVKFKKNIPQLSRRITSWTAAATAVAAIAHSICWMAWGLVEVWWCWCVVANVVAVVVEVAEVIASVYVGNL